jgi:hypothetical protein
MAIPYILSLVSLIKCHFMPHILLTRGIEIRNRYIKFVDVEKQVTNITIKDAPCELSNQVICAFCPGFCHRRFSDATVWWMVGLWTIFTFSSVVVGEYSDIKSPEFAHNWNKGSTVRESVHFSTSFTKGIAHTEILEELEKLVEKNLIQSIQIAEKNCIVTVVIICFGSRRFVNIEQ